MVKVAIIRVNLGKIVDNSSEQLYPNYVGKKGIYISKKLGGDYYENVN
jgi:hypothetical protein